MAQSIPGYREYLSCFVESFLQGRRGPAPLTLRRALLVLLGVPPFLMLQAIHRVALALDDVLFPGYRRVEVRQPVFVTGVPRSGTTFLHRLLAKDEDRFTTTALWELVFAPAICERKLVLAIAAADRVVGRPLARLLAWLQRAVLGGLDDVHGTALDDPEEDYLGLIPYGACFILVLAFPFSETLWSLARFDTGLPDDARRRILNRYRGLVQRHLYVRGPDKQYLAKNPSFTSWVRSLHEAFPDARIVGCVRTPYKTIPSLLSSMESGAKLFAVDPDGTFFPARLYETVCHYYAHLAEELPRLPEDQHAFTTLETMSKAPRDTVAGLYERFGMTLSPAFDGRLSASERESRGYKSKHTYTLDQFGLTAGEVHERLAFAFETFGFKPDPAPATNKESAA
jgi:hypothetical protein